MITNEVITEKVVQLVKKIQSEPPMNFLEKLNIWHHPSTGRFTSPGGAIAPIAMVHGGSSINITTGEAPKDGYMVAVNTDRERVLEIDVSQKQEVVEKELAKQFDQYVKDNKGVLKQPNNF